MADSKWETTNSHKHAGSEEAQLTAKVAHASLRLNNIDMKMRLGLKVQIVIFVTLFLFTLILFSSQFAIHSHDVTQVSSGRMEIRKEATHGGGRPEDFSVHIKELDSSYQSSYTWNVYVEKVKRESLYSYSSSTYQAIQRTSDGFPVRGYDKITANLKLYIPSYQSYSDDKVYLSLAFHGPDTQIKSYPEVQYVLKDVRGNVNHLAITAAAPPSSTFRPGVYYYNVTVASTATFYSPQYVEDNYAMLEVYVEPPSVVQSIYSENGVFWGRVKGFSEKKELEKSGVEHYQTGQYFYTHSQGYKVKARVYLNGYSYYKGQGLTVAVVFTSGEHDSSLATDCPFTANITLLNQEDSSKHLSKSLEINPKHRSIYYAFMGYSYQIEGAFHGFILQDTLYYKIHIEKVPDSNC